MTCITDNDVIRIAAELKFRGDNAHRRDAYAAAGRFCRAAGMLGRGHLGWQAVFGKDGEASAMSFSDSDWVTAGDIGWIFGCCADTEELPCRTLSGLFGGERKVYSLNPARCGAREDTGYGDTDLTDGGYGEVADLLSGSGAVIRACAGKDMDGSWGGALFLSLEEPLTLRLRAALSDAFPSLELEEMTAGTPVRTAPPAAVRDAIGGLMYEMTVRSEKRRRDKKREEPDAGAGPCPVVFTPIEELDLSLRAYNCLKRAGISSVEQLRDMSGDDLRRIRNLGARCVDEVLRKLGRAQRLPEVPRVQGKNAADILDGMVGLHEIKEQVRRIAAFARMRQAMAENGGEDVPVVLNMEFTGNPGTAKTTAARALAGILSDIGILSSPEPIEVGRADLVAGYVGQTAGKVREVFERAKGRLLFIDEAYSLDDGAGGYGDEALAAIVQEMENSPGDPVVIFSGYPDRMEELFSRNPGLRSRVPFTVRFPDYTAEEMAQITEMEARKRGFEVSGEGKSMILSICANAQGRRETGNGRFCRNLAENAILSFAARTCGDGEVSPAGEHVLTGRDFAAPPVQHAGSRGALIGFGERN